MLNVIKVFDVMHVDSATGRPVWTRLTGTRTPLKRGGHMIDPKAMGYRVARLARLSRCRTPTPASAALGHPTARRNHSMSGSRVP
jgi:hypothetical protein